MGKNSPLVYRELVGLLKRQADKKAQKGRPGVLP